MMNLPLSQQEHQPLVFLSGSFKGSSLRWPIIDKEAFAIITTLTRCEYLCKRERGVHIYTDHRNLIYLFDPVGTVGAVARPQADRLDRWRCILASFHYFIHHVPGELICGRTC